MNFNHIVTHETKRVVFGRFLVVLFIFISYFLYVAYKFGAQDGLVIALISWSVFVLATPIADAGFLLDFPIRILTGIKMIYSEAIVWSFAILLNVYFLWADPDIYNSTNFLKMFYKILTTPFPYWFILALSFVGTFLSVYVADEFMTKIKKHEISLSKPFKKAHNLVVATTILAIVLFLYYEMVYYLSLDI